MKRRDKRLAALAVAGVAAAWAVFTGHVIVGSACAEGCPGCRYCGVVVAVKR